MMPAEKKEFAAKKAINSDAGKPKRISAMNAKHV